MEVITQLEDWLIDIEPAASLTDESRTKLAESKSKGLTHTLITEALISGKCGEEIKDLPSSQNLQFRHSYISKPLQGYSAKGQEITSSLHT